jgi:chromosome partitioning protein
MATLAAEHPGVLAGAIPASTEVERMGLHRAPVAVTAPRSRAAAAFEILWSELGERLALAT